MKKLLYILFAAFLFVACSSDDEKEDDKPYFNPVEGSWIDKRGEESFTRMTYYKDFVQTYLIYNNGYFQTASTEYTIDRDSIYRKKSVIAYKINIDTLYLYVPVSGEIQTQKYIREK